MLARDPTLTDAATAALSTDNSSAIDLEALRATQLVRDPFEFVIVPNLVRREALAAVTADFPRITEPGSFPLDKLAFGPAFAALVAELRGPAMTDCLAEKFGVDLRDHPTLATIRGRCRASDGKIHTDSESKIITVLVYLNSSWEANGGRLRLLRSATDLEDFAAEVPPDAGTLLAFRRSENSFHGHKSFVGERRSIQINWVRDAGVARREQARHRLSAWFKRLKPSS